MKEGGLKCATQNFELHSKIGRPSAARVCKATLARILRESPRYPVPQHKLPFSTVAIVNHWTKPERERRICGQGRKYLRGYLSAFHHRSEMGAAPFPFFIQPLLCDRMLIPFSMPSNSAFLRRGNLIVSDGGGNARLPFHTW